MKFKVIYGFCMAVCLATVLTVCGTVLNGFPLTLATFLPAFGVSFLAGLFVGVVIPLREIGDWYAAAYGSKPNEPLGCIIGALVRAVIMVGFISFVSIAFQTGFGPLGDTNIIMRWIGAYTLMWPVGFVAILVCIPIAKTLTMKALGIPTR